jgi:5-methylcytosine-specific restriction endonuclease McrA
MDRFQKLDGRFDEASYLSSLYFLARRLVILCKHAVEESVETNDADTIRKAIESVFDLDLIADSGRLLQLVYECYQHSKKSLSKGLNRRLKREAKEKDALCYLCGSDLYFGDDPKDNRYETEHLLPRGLGGGNFEKNLAPSCHSCNNFKRNRISGEDLHYESLVYKNEKSSEIKEFHVFAAALFNGSKCSLCGKSMRSEGSMKCLRGNSKDVWHLFNLEHICESCELEANKNK